MHLTKQKTSNIFLAFLIILENFFLFYAFREFHFSQVANATALFSSSLLFGLVLLYRFYGQSARVRDIKLKLGFPQYLFIALFTVGLLYLAFGSRSIFHQNPIGPQYSDIIPEIQVACKRFLSGRNVYQPITEFGWTLELTYLPLQWLPYTAAEVLAFDYRWIAYGIWAFAALLLFTRALRTNNLSQQCFAGILIILSNYILLMRNPGIIASTVEIMVAGYYMLLIIGLNQRSAIVLGLCLSLCLLSRFSVLLWLPLGAFVLYTNGDRKPLLTTGITVIVVVLIIYVLPFLSRDWSSLYRGYKYYDHSAMGEWHKHSDEQYPAQLHAGTGFAYLFYTGWPENSVARRLKLLQKTHLILSVGITVAMGAWYWFTKRNIDRRIFLMGSFKIYLAFFLAFIQVPYEYLMIVGNFVSIAIFCEQIRYEVIPLAKDPPSQNTDT